MRPGGLMLIDAAGADANKSFRFKQKGSFGGTPQTNILISAEKCVLHLLVNFSVRCLKGVQQKKKKNHNTELGLLWFLANYFGHLQLFVSQPVVHETTNCYQAIKSPLGC